PYFFHPPNKHHIISKIYPTPFTRYFPDKNPVSPISLHTFQSPRQLIVIYTDKHTQKIPSMVLYPDTDSFYPAF
ncbi:hypothetical protein, partial [Serratia quinivorans]|uniref:hypothetical protein n=1 Tax=Serratia quinivorans TaxID=137545 RepID=UPI0034C602BC